MSIDDERMRRDTSRTKPIVMRAPANADTTIIHGAMTALVPRTTTIVNATTNFEPDEMPSTKGLAMGLLKNVCSRKPESARAAPSTMQARRRGRRICQMMSDAMEEASPPTSAAATSSIETSTLPMHRFSNVNTTSAMARTTRTTAVRVARPVSP